LEYSNILAQLVKKIKNKLYGQKIIWNTDTL